MPSLIHLNGLAGIGKSALSALYAERHPDVLNLDIDTLDHLLDGWRPMALAVAHRISAPDTMWCCLITSFT